MKDGFITPPKHINFETKKLFGATGQIIDGSIAYITLKGGGPIEQHTHEHNHLFIVVKGEAKVLLDNEEVIIPENEAFLVKGTIPHSVWSNKESETGEKHLRIMLSTEIFILKNFINREDSL